MKQFLLCAALIANVSSAMQDGDDQQHESPQESLFSTFGIPRLVSGVKEAFAAVMSDQRVQNSLHDVKTLFDDLSDEEAQGQLQSGDSSEHLLTDNNRVDQELDALRERIVELEQELEQKKRTEAAMRAVLNEGK